MKKALLVLALGGLSFVHTSNAQQPLFATDSAFAVYQPSNACSNCIFSPTLTATGDFKGDGNIDLAYIDVGSSGGADNFLVIAFGQSTGTPSQVATDLGACTASALATADVDHDGHLDVVILCSQGYANTLLGNGDGTFKAPLSSTVPGEASAVVLANFNGDDLPDAAFVFSSNSGGGYAISLNSGGGKFGTPQSYSLPAGTIVGSTLAVGDFNGDGKNDLFFGNGYVLGNGDGTFGANQSLPFPVSSYAIGDFNQDGFDDVAFLKAGTTPFVQENSPIYLLEGSSAGLSSQPIQVTAQLYGSGGAQSPSPLLGAFKLGTDRPLSLVAGLSGAAVSILPGNGDGTFGSPVDYAGTLSAFADVNADGILDLVKNEPQTNPAIGWAQGNSNGSFQGVPFTLIPNGQNSIVADMNGDGLPDVIGSPGTPSAPQVFLSAGNGRFLPAPQNSTSAAGDFGSIFVAADFNGDGKQDIVSISPGCNSQCNTPPTSQLLSYRGNGDGTLTYLNQSNLGIVSPIGAVAGAFKPSGNQSLVVAFDGVSSGDGGAVYVAGNGDGSFAAPVTIPLLGASPSLIVSADLKGNGIPDLVIADANGTVASYLGNGDGTFTSVAPVLSAAVRSMAVSDVTGDGIPDLICLTSNITVEVFEGKGDGSFNTTPIFSSPAIYGADVVEVGDLNGDGKPDIALGYIDINTQTGVQVFLNQGSGVFTQDPATYLAGSAVSPIQFALTRLNRNASSSGNKMYLDGLFLGPGAASLLNVNNPAPASTPTLSLSLDGQANLVAGQTITLYATVTPNSGNANISGTVSFTANGTQIGISTVAQNKASIPFVIPSAGLFLFQATYSGDANDSGALASLSITATASTSTTTLTSSASTATAGTAITFTATVSPTTATGTVTFLDGTTPLGQGTLSSGVVTFSTSGLSAGSHSITAAYGGDTNDLASTSSALSISITAPTLQFSASPSTVSIAQGSSGSTTITVTPVGVYSGAVTLGCTGLPAYSTCTFSPATLTFSGAANEAAQTTTLTINTNVSAGASVASADSHSRYRDSSGMVSLAILLLPAWIFVRRRRFGRFLGVVLLLLWSGTALLVSGCGSGSSVTISNVTPVGTSTVGISASGLSASLNLTVTITQ